MSNKLINWVIFIVLCLIWGSSFILMKIGLYDDHNQPMLSAYQVAALRLLSAGLVLLPFQLVQWRKIPLKQAGYIILSGLLGSFIPAFLFCIAETKIDSGLAGTLNALTPIFVILSGLVLYGNKVPVNKIWGIVLGFTGSFLLFVTQKHNGLGEKGFAGLIIIATLFYGINVNMVQKRLSGVSSTTIAGLAFSALSVPSLVILWFTGYFSLPLGKINYLKATGASCLLGVMGTAFASIIFYMLLKRGGAVFASLVTYGIPFVALGWGWVYGETITLAQVFCLLIILGGVYIANLDFKKMMGHINSKFHKK